MRGEIMACLHVFSTNHVGLCGVTLKNKMYVKINNAYKTVILHMSVNHVYIAVHTVYGGKIVNSPNLNLHLGNLLWRLLFGGKGCYNGQKSCERECQEIWLSCENAYEWGSLPHPIWQRWWRTLEHSTCYLLKKTVQSESAAAHPSVVWCLETGTLYLSGFIRQQLSWRTGSRLSIALRSSAWFAFMNVSTVSTPLGC